MISSILKRFILSTGTVMERAATTQGGSVDGFTIVKLDEIPTRDAWIPVRDHFGIQGFGVNAYRAEQAGGVVIDEHTETLGQHEELYLVVAGHATFTIDGGEIDAPAGTLVFVGDPATPRSAVAKEAETTVLVAGARPGHAFEVAAWELGGDQ
jgi:quercetin dioxygenase-like cupin family protein